MNALPEDYSYDEEDVMEVWGLMHRLTPLSNGLANRTLEPGLQAQATECLGAFCRSLIQHSPITGDNPRQAGRGDAGESAVWRLDALAACPGRVRSLKRRKPSARQLMLCVCVGGRVVFSHQPEPFSGAIIAASPGG